MAGSPEFGDPEQHVETSPNGRYIRYNAVLGRGAYKTVYKAFDTEEALEVAWNKLHVDRLSDYDLDKVSNEVSLLRQVEHKNIIRFYDTWHEGDPNDDQTINFITEQMISGTLKEYLKKAKAIKLKVIRRWCRNILEAIAYLHSQKPPIMHRDLKCDNIFINGHVGEVKIGDLGLSGVKERDKAESVIGTPEFMAPELYEESYTEKVDIYAFGMCLLEIVTMEYPYSECNNMAQIFKKVFDGEKPKAFSSLVDGDVKDVIAACLEREVNRPSAAELLDHPLFKNWDDDSGQISNLFLVKGVEDTMQGSLGSALRTSQSSNAMPIGTELIDWSDPLKRSVLVSMKEGGETNKEGEEQQVSVVAAKDNGDFYIGLEIPIRDAIKRVEFSFDPFEDSSQHIAQEMVSEFRLGQEQLEVIRAEIDRQVQQAKQQRETASRNATPQSTPRTIEHQNQIGNNPPVTPSPLAHNTIPTQAQGTIPHVQQSISRPATPLPSAEPFTSTPIDSRHPPNMTSASLPDPHSFTPLKPELPRPPDPLMSVHQPPGGNLTHSEPHFISEVPPRRLDSRTHTIGDQPSSHRVSYNNLPLASDQQSLGSHSSIPNPTIAMENDLSLHQHTDEPHNASIADHGVLPPERQLEVSGTMDSLSTVETSNVARGYNTADNKMNVSYISEDSVRAPMHERRPYDEIAPPISHDYTRNAIRDIDPADHIVKDIHTAPPSGHRVPSIVADGNSLPKTFASHVLNTATLEVAPSSSLPEKSFDSTSAFASRPAPLSSHQVQDFQTPPFGGVPSHKPPEDVRQNNVSLLEHQVSHTEEPESSGAFLHSGLERISIPMNSVRPPQVGNSPDDLKEQHQTNSAPHRSVGNEYIADFRGENPQEEPTIHRDKSNAKGHDLNSSKPAFHEVDPVRSVPHSVSDGQLANAIGGQRLGVDVRRDSSAIKSSETIDPSFEHGIGHEISSSAGFGPDGVGPGLFIAQPRGEEVDLIVDGTDEKQSGGDNRGGSLTLPPADIPCIVVVSNEPAPNSMESDRPRRLTEGSVSLTEGSVDSLRSAYGTTNSGDYGGQGKRLLLNSQDQTVQKYGEGYSSDGNLRERQPTVKSASGEHGQGNTWGGTREANTNSSVSVKTEEPGSSAKTDKSIKKCLKLMNFCARGRYDDVKNSLLNGASVTFCDYDRRTPLHLAAGEGHANVCALLIENGAEISAKDRWGNTALSDAYDNNRVEVVELLKRHGADDGDDDLEELEMLHFCAVGDVNAVRNALTGGASTSFVDYDKRTALHVACSEGHAEVAEVLLLNGASPDAVDRKKRTPVDDAITNGHRDVLRILKRYGAKIPRHMHEADGYHLHCLGVELIEESAKGNERDVKQCLDYGADVNFKHYDRRTALHLACVEGHIEIVRILLEAGAETDVEDRWGNTPLDEAETGGWKEVVDALEQVRLRMADDLRDADKGRVSSDILNKHGENSDSMAFYTLAGGFSIGIHQVSTDDYVSDGFPVSHDGVNLDGTPATMSLPLTPFDHGSERFDDKKSDEHGLTQNFGDVESNVGGRVVGWARDDTPSNVEPTDAGLEPQSGMMQRGSEVHYSPSLLSMSSMCNGPEAINVVNSEGDVKDQSSRVSSAARTVVPLFNTQGGSRNASLDREGLERGDIPDVKADVRTLVEGLIKTVVDAAAGG